MKEFLTDAEMNDLEKTAMVNVPDFISDDEMNKIESSPSYDYSNLPKDLAQATVDTLPQVGQMAGEYLGAGNPIVSGIGQMAGESVRGVVEGVKDIYQDPQKFLSDLSRLPTKEQVIDEVNKYIGAFNQGAVSTMAGKVLTKGVDKIAESTSKLSKPIQKQAEQMAETATGATGLQASKFRPEAGRELLDRKVVQFGDTPAKVAQKAGETIDAANLDIDTALKALDQKGIKINQNDIISNIQKQAVELAKDPSQAPVVKKLSSIIDDITNTGEDFISSSAAEKSKRGFNKIAKNWLDPESGQAGKIAYRAYRDAVEETATKEAPELAKLFKEAKKSYGLMAPIEEAASRRAATLNQSPLGGLLDVATVTGGALAGDPTSGVAVALARRMIAPRLASSGAVTLDKISDVLSKTPEFAKIATDKPQVFSSLANKVLESYKSKGEEKWTIKGTENLLESGLSQEKINKLNQSKKGKSLLIRASDLKPNSKQIQNLMKEIGE